MPLIDVPAIEAALTRHEKAALYLSGGKDSLAMLYVMRPWWEKLTVVWLDTGDAPEKTHELMERIKQMVPSFLHVRSNQPEVIATDGLPIDLNVPEMAGEFGNWMSQVGMKFQNRYDCCSKVLWQPLHNAIVDSGFTLLIRGQKENDPVRPNSRNGDHYDKFELLFPLNEWSDDDVFDYLQENAIPVLGDYSYGRSNIDCCTCTAYLHEFDRGRFLKEQEPEKYPLYRSRLAMVTSQVEPHLDALVRESRECFS